MPVRLSDFERGAAISMSMSGRPVRGYVGETVGVALWAQGEAAISRSIKYHRPRGIFCMEGSCGSCLMRIGGRPNVPACLEPCQGDLEIEGQNALPTPEMDLLGAVDWLFPGGMNHHTLMTGSKVLNQITNKVVRKLSGLGELPRAIAGNLPPVRTIETPVCVIGAGRSGLAAARTAAAAGKKTVLIEGFSHPGGSLLADPTQGIAAVARASEELVAAGVSLHVAARAIGFYPEDAGGVLVVATAEGLVRVFAKSYVYTTGGYAQNRAFPDNDRPGVLAARAVGRMLTLYGILAGERILLVGIDRYSEALASELEARGAHVTIIDGEKTTIERVHGGSRVSGATLSDGSDVTCDVICVQATPAPASELLRQHGAEVELQPSQGGFVARVSDDGQTSVANVFAAGRVAGSSDPGLAIRAGHKAAEVA